jgi:proteasome accessory factor B
VSRKSERLVNLTIALLATKRWLTKAEIFANVAGYSGDSEAKDRMFERDKDDLRSLGINIELGSSKMRRDIALSLSLTHFNFMI